jgi:hypothetical protein
MGEQPSRPSRAWTGHPVLLGRATRRCDFEDGLDDGVPCLDGKSSSGTEVILHVDNEENIL